MRCKVVVAGFAIALGFAGLAHAQSAGAKEPAFTFGAQYEPTYMKFKSDGETSDKGWIHAAKFYAKIRPAGSFVIEPSLKIYAGDLKSDDYKYDMSGWNAEAKFGYQICAGGMKITPYLGFGHEYMSFSNVDIGFDEEDEEENLEGVSLGRESLGNVLRKTYGKIGIAPVFGTGNYYIYGDLYMRYPFSLKFKNKNGDDSVKPKKKVGFGVEVGLGMNNFIKKGLKANVALFYEYDKYGKREQDDVDTKRYLYGVRLGLSF